jgi:hypothetical protein
LECTQQTTTSGHDDFIPNVLHDLPEQWVGKEKHDDADRRDATWITKRVLEDVERGLLLSKDFTLELLLNTSASDLAKILGWNL